MHEIVRDAGGEARVASVRMQLVRRYAALSCLAEAAEARLAAGETIDAMEHCQIASTRVRLASRLGLDRHQREVPSLRDYLSQREIDSEAGE